MYWICLPGSAALLSGLLGHNPMDCVHSLASLTQDEVLIEWPIEDKLARPHRSLGYLAPTDYTETEPSECALPWCPAGQPAHWIARQFSAVVEWMRVSTVELGL
jgi:hypothetical protein